MSDGVSEFFEPLSAALSKVPEPERYRLLGSFLVEFAGRQEVDARRPAGPSVEELSKKLHRFGEEKAQVEDALAGAKADLAHRTTQHEAEQQRSGELERIVGDQRARLQSAQKEVVELEGQLVAKNERLYEAENQVERLTLELQRAQLQAGDTSRLEKIENGRRELIVQLEELREAHEQLRVDKDAVIEQLKTELVAARSGSAGGADATLAALWDRLARVKPPLAPGGVHPPTQAVERLFDAFIELARFVHDFDQSMRPFLSTFVRHNQAIARPWDVYARSPGLKDVIREIIDVERGQLPGVLKMRLTQGVQRWTMSAVIASDAALESIGDELERHLRGPRGMGADPNRKIRDYVRDDGHHLFHQHIRELRSQKLAEVYTHGG